MLTRWRENAAADRPGSEIEALIGHAFENAAVFYRGRPARPMWFRSRKKSRPSSILVSSGMGIAIVPRGRRAWASMGQARAAQVAGHAASRTKLSLAAVAGIAGTRGPAREAFMEVLVETSLNRRDSVAINQDIYSNPRVLEVWAFLTPCKPVWVNCNGGWPLTGRKVDNEII